MNKKSEQERTRKRKKQRKRWKKWAVGKRIREKRIRKE